MATKPDLDSKENIKAFIDRFYQQVLVDPLLRPIFIDVAGIDLERHLGHIRAYWEKLLLGAPDYQRNTMEVHRQLNAKHALQPVEFDRWLALFLRTADTHFAGPLTEKAKSIAGNIAGNMEDRFFRGMDSTQPRQLYRLQD